jgi:hypothetical protein
MSALTEQIRSKGHWDIAIRPERFASDRVPYADLDDLLTELAVRFRGWPVPFVDNRVPPIRGDDWIGQDIDAEMVSHFEAWRFFTSGQFNQLRVISADWRSGREATPIPAGFSSVVEVWEILYYLTEVFELGARLALSAAGDESMVLDVRLNGLSGRGLVVGQPNRAPFMVPYPAPNGDLKMTVTLTRERLVADVRTAAVEMAQDFFVRFGWKPSTQQLAELQLELTSGR